MRYSTAIQKCTIPGAKWFGRFYIVGSIPATCYDESRPGSKGYDTEEEALSAVLADPWIQATPDQTIQDAKCRVVNRAVRHPATDPVNLLPAVVAAMGGLK